MIAHLSNARRIVGPGSALRPSGMTSGWGSIGAFLTPRPPSVDVIPDGLRQRGDPGPIERRANHRSFQP